MYKHNDILIDVKPSECIKFGNALIKNTCLNRNFILSTIRPSCSNYHKWPLVLKHVEDKPCINIKSGNVSFRYKALLETKQNHSRLGILFCVLLYIPYHPNDTRIQNQIWPEANLTWCYVKDNLRNIGSTNVWFN